jgi:hypothetical protein
MGQEETNSYYKMFSTSLPLDYLIFKEHELHCPYINKVTVGQILTPEEQVL